MIANEFLPSFRETLLTGGYNLLLGSGISLDSHNRKGELLRSAEALRLHLCRLTGAPEQTSLSRIYPLLSKEQVQGELEEPYSGCVPGPSLAKLPHFLWRRIFTFNIDDVLENLYQTSRASKQGTVPLTFASPFEPTPERHSLRTIHLHGWAGRPGDGFVFSAQEYARQMSSNNSWTQMLSEILATEPFIVAGTSLNEMDLEYFLSFRTPVTPRRGRGPSLLIEPHPNVVVESDCLRHGLTLIRATFGAFLEWLAREFPSPPTVAELLVPDVDCLFEEKPTSWQLVRLFSDFRMVTASERPISLTPSPFLYGREPDENDLAEHKDVERQDNLTLVDAVRTVSASKDAKRPRLLLVVDEAGSGKTTAIKRASHDLVRSGSPVLAVNTLSRIDVETARACFSRLAAKPVVLLVDSLGDHIEQVAELLEDEEASRHITILGAERTYRLEHIANLMKGTQWEEKRLSPLTHDEAQQLIERYRRYGLVGDGAALQDPRRFARLLLGDPIAVAVCRIMNDFQPLDTIVESLWKAADGKDKFSYLCCTLAQHCYMGGIRYSLLQLLAGSQTPIAPLLEGTRPLKLSVNAVDEDFVIAANSVVAERILHMVARTQQELLLTAFQKVASVVAPHVNRKALMRRSPEARLAGRLFDADKVVKPLLGDAAERFYVAVQKGWEWNSRYWEQRALLSVDSDIELALRYARHAVAIEEHAFPLTTLGKVLLARMEAFPAERDVLFREAFLRLCSAIYAERAAARVNVHPYAMLFIGTVHFLEMAGTLTPEQREYLEDHMERARERFSDDRGIMNLIRRLEEALSSGNGKAPQGNTQK